jgi:hypothetical protein
MSDPGWVSYEPRLVEEAVFHAVRNHPQARAFHRQKDRLYEIADLEAREAAFHDLHAAWFEKLGLGRPIAQALEEQPAIRTATRSCQVRAARTRQEEGAELFVGPSREGQSERERRWVIVRLAPEALSAADRVLGFLRHELLHIADMLDPRFGYWPRLPQPAAAPAAERLLRDRYGVLWDTTIDGRLARLGRAPAAVRADRLREFARTFPTLGSLTEETFARFFEADCCTHADLASFAASPRQLAGSPASGPRPPAPAPRPRPGDPCPLCRFPTHAFASGPEGLPADVLDRIRTDFPTWEPGQGLCRQCADLYRARRGAWPA